MVGGSISLFAASAGAALPRGAAAQDAAEKADQADSGDIVVTARKREERAQDVPVSITAFSSQELERRGFQGFKDLAIGNPNVKVGEVAGNGVSFGVSIRGNLQNGATLPIDPSVGIYQDGFLVAHSFGTMGLTTDLRSVQTLKGPQGTLFGRNTTGGAILIETNDPKLGAVSGYAQADIGEIGTRQFGAALNIPINDRAALRVTYQNNVRGDYETLSNGRTLGRKSAYLIRGKLLVEPTDRLSLVFTAEKSRERLNATQVTPSQPNNPVYDNVPVVTYVSPSANAPGQSPSDPRADDELQMVESQFYAFKATQEVGSGNIKLLVAHRAYDLILRQTLPPSFGYTQQDKPGNSDVSAELQYNGSFLDGRLTVAAGGFYFREHVNERQLTYLYSGIQRTTRLLSAHTESKSGYLQATFQLTPRLRLTGGLRYTDDRKWGTLYSSTRGTDGNGSVDGPGDLAAALANPVASLTVSNNKLNYLISIDYKPTEDVMIYANTASGYRSGGLGNDRRGAPGTANYLSITSFLPESVKNYEVGFKSQFLDRHVTLNGAAFYQDYKDYQYTAVDPDTTQRVTLNVNATIKGFELGGEIKLDSGTRLSANVGLVDGKVNSGPSKGSALLQVPKWTYDITLGQDFNIAGGTLSLVATYNWRSRYSTSLNDPLAAGDEVHDSNIDALGLLNVSASYRTGPWDLSIYANNLTNEKYYSALLYASGGVIDYGTLGLPRVIGARAKYSF